MTTNSEPLNAQEEADLAAFLTKISAACKTDSSVPGFVDAQVTEWLGEIAAGGTAT